MRKGSLQAKSRERRDLAITIALVAAASAVRAYAISRGHQLDIDEADTALKVAKPLGDLIADLRRDGHPPLYFLLLKGWTALFGRGESALRSLSLLFSCGTLVLLLATARRLFGRTAALFAGLFFLLSPVEIFHASEGRMYTLLPLLALGALALACEIAVGANAGALSRRNLLLLLAALIAALYTHNYGLFLPAAVALFALWILADGERRGPRERESGAAQTDERVPRDAPRSNPASITPAPLHGAHHRALAGSLLAVAAAAYVCYLPWLPILQAQRESKAHVWLVEFFEATPPILAVPLSLAALAGTGPYPPITPPMQDRSPLLPVMLPLGIIVFAAGVMRAFRDDRVRAAPLVFLVVALGAPWLVSITAKVIYLVGRYDVIALPFVMLLLGAGAATLVRWRRALMVVPLAFLLSPLPAVAALFALRAGGDVVEQVSWVASHPETRAVVATQLAGSRFRYYLAKSGRRDAIVRSFPTSTDEHTGWYERPRADDPALAANADSLLADFHARLAPGDLLWATLYDNDVAKPVLVQTLARYFAPVPEATRFDLGLIAVTKESNAPAEMQGRPGTR